MPAISTIAVSAIAPGAGPTAAAAAPGDSLTVQNFPASGEARLFGLVRRGATGGLLRVRSPRMHDNVTGINFHSSEAVSSMLLPPQAAQSLYAGDTLIAELGGGGAGETDLGAIQMYYTDLPGSSARLNAWGDIAGIIRGIKSFQVAVTNSATAGDWTDTVITATENQLHADSDYAVLGYVTDAAQGVVGIKGQETGNLRVCGPGTALGLDTSDYFLRLSNALGLPAIPVFNANNRAGVYVSSVDSVASTTANVTIICAELSQSAPH